MGSSPEVGFDRFPEQSDILGKVCRVSFHEDPSRAIAGTVVRADVEPEGSVIIRLDDGRLVLDSECEFGFSADWTAIVSQNLEDEPNFETGSDDQAGAGSVGIDTPQAVAPLAHPPTDDHAEQATGSAGQAAEDDSEAHPN